VPGETIRLERFDGWYGRTAYLDAVELDLRTIDPLTRYENGEIDVTPVGAADRERVSDPLNPLHYEVLQGDGDMGVTYVGLNTRMPPFDDRAVRRALAQAIDRERLADVILQGAAEPSAAILPPGMPGHTATANPYDYDPQAARQALVESRYGGAASVPPITLNVAGESGDAPVAEAVADILKESLPGLRVTVEQSPWEQYQQEIDAGTYPMFIQGWAADYLDPQDFLDLQFHSDSELNETGFADAQVDEWLEAARVERDPTRRLALYGQAERRVLAAAPWVPLYTGTQLWLVSDRVHGFAVPSIVRPRLADVWLSEG
jgi:ABC-type transport system substrate-binding protein